MGLFSSRAKRNLPKRETQYLYFLALACIFGGVAHKSAPPPPPPKINNSHQLPWNRIKRGILRLSQTEKPQFTWRMWAFFVTEQMPKEHTSKRTKKLYNDSYFEAGRRRQNRSILGVCEDFDDKPDAKRALLDDFSWILNYKIVTLQVRSIFHIEQIQKQDNNGIQFQRDRVQVA